jgi:uncharacterized membrane protein
MAQQADDAPGRHAPLVGEPSQDQIRRFIDFERELPHKRKYPRASAGPQSHVNQPFSWVEAGKWWGRGLRFAFRGNWTRLFGGAQHVRLAPSGFENMDQAQQADALRAEYLHLQKTVEDFDGKALTIKAWSVTFSLAVLVGAFTSHSKLVVLVAAIASALFWFLETLWKSFQLGYYSRIEAIEAHFRGASDQIAPNQICGSWMARWRKTTWGEIFAMAFWPHIALPHCAVFLGGVGLFLLAHYGHLTL